MNLNDYIVSNANGGFDEGFLLKYASEEVYFSIENPGSDLKDGPLTVSAGVELKVQVAKLSTGSMALLYASKNDPRLSARFGGMPLFRAGEMIRDLPDVDGMLIQSDGDAWLAVPKDVLKNVLGRRRGQVR